MGYKLAGYDVLAALDFDEKAINSYQFNFSETKAILADITKVSGDDFKRVSDDFQLWDGMGNAVPPLMIKAIAKKIELSL